MSGKRDLTPSMKQETKAIQDRLHVMYKNLDTLTTTVIGVAAKRDNLGKDQPSKVNAAEDIQNRLEVVSEKLDMMAATVIEVANGIEWQLGNSDHDLGPQDNVEEANAIQDQLEDLSEKLDVMTATVIERTNKLQTKVKVNEAKAIQGRLEVMSKKLDTMTATVINEWNKQIDNLEEDLRNLKQFASTNKIGLDEKIADVNTKIEHVAKNMINERKEDLIRFKEIFTELVVLVDKLDPLIDAYDVPESEKNAVREHLSTNRAAAQKELDEPTEYINALFETFGGAEIGQAIITRSNVESKVDDVLGWLQRTREFLFPKRNANAQQ